jgi:hypothetical protein
MFAKVKKKQNNMTARKDGIFFNNLKLNYYESITRS